MTVTARQTRMEYAASPRPARTWANSAAAVTMTAAGERWIVARVQAASTVTTGRVKIIVEMASASQDRERTAVRARLIVGAKQANTATTGRAKTIAEMVYANQDGARTAVHVRLIAGVQADRSVITSRVVRPGHARALVNSAAADTKTIVAGRWIVARAKAASTVITGDAKTTAGTVSANLDRARTAARALLIASVKQTSTARTAHARTIAEMVYANQDGVRIVVRVRLIAGVQVARSAITRRAVRHGHASNWDGSVGPVLSTSVTVN